MAKDSTNPLNIEWFSYENYDLDYASCGHKRSGFTKTCSHLYPFIPVKRTVKKEGGKTFSINGGEYGEMEKAQRDEISKMQVQRIRFEYGF